MTCSKSSLFLIFFLLAAVGTAFVLTWFHTAGFSSYADMKTVLTTTTATLGTLLGIITAGIMFTQGRFNQLSSELGEKLPEYIADVLSLERIQAIEARLFILRRAFSQIAEATTIAQEKNLYERVVRGTSDLYVSFAVLLNLKLRQQGLTGTRFLTSEMSSVLFHDYEKGVRRVKKEWQVLSVMRKITDVWEGSPAYLVGEPERMSSLSADLKSSVSLWKLKEKIDRNLASTHGEVTDAVDDLEKEIGGISKKLHEDKVPQLLSQMEGASTVRGKYFYLAVIFIAVPLLVNLAILPQLNEATAASLKPVVSITSALSVMSVLFLLLYVRRLLSV